MQRRKRIHVVDARRAAERRALEDGAALRRAAPAPPPRLPGDGGADASGPPTTVTNFRPSSAHTSTAPSSRTAAMRQAM